MRKLSKSWCYSFFISEGYYELGKRKWQNVKMLNVDYIMKHNTMKANFWAILALIQNANQTTCSSHLAFKIRRAETHASPFPSNPVGVRKRVHAGFDMNCTTHDTQGISWFQISWDEA